MRIFKTKRFGRFARKERLTDRRLIESIDRATMGLVDADLGGHLIKQRIARSGEGTAKELLSLTSAQLDELVEQGELEEIETDA